MPSKGHYDNPVRFLNQNYSSLRKKAVGPNKRFVDTKFPADGSSLFYTASKSVSGVEWKRPTELCPDPRLFSDTSSARQLKQGIMGNCWMVTACSCMAFHKDIWSKVIPNHKEQDWNRNKPQKHPGIFRFRFWRFGSWVEVVIDDLLPTKNGQLIFCHSRETNEFWGALVEKAYAKLFGSYEALSGGDLSEGLEDFSGGVSEMIDIQTFKASGEQNVKDLFTTMKKSWDKKAMMAAAIPAKHQREREGKTSSGLVIGHAYSVTAVKTINVKHTGLLGLFRADKLDMVRLRNPWGGVEWNGAFGDGSAEWKRVSKTERNKMGLTFEDDGEFWMTFADFEKHFRELCICRVVNTQLLSLQKTWHESLLHGEWRSPDRAGGCNNKKNKFFNNPQYMFKLSKTDEVMFSLTQKSTRGKNAADKLSIGFTILKAETNRHYRLHSQTEVVESCTFSNSRSVFLRHTINKGRYIVVLATFQPNLKGSFLFRMYTDDDHSGSKLTLDAPPKPCGCLPLNHYKLVTRVTIVKSHGLKGVNPTGSCDAYVVVTCEGQNFESETIKHSNNPEWNFSTVFHRKKPAKPITVQVYNANAFRDDFLGQVTLDKEFNSVKNMQYTMALGNKHGDQLMPGKIILQVSSSSNFLDV